MTRREGRSRAEMSEWRGMQGNANRESNWSVYMGHRGFLNILRLFVWIFVRSQSMHGHSVRCGYGNCCLVQYNNSNK